MSKIQSILFDKKRWTYQTAFKWLQHHHQRPIKGVHETKHFLRYRIRPPHHFMRFITKKLPDGIDLVIGFS